MFVMLAAMLPAATGNQPNNNVSLLTKSKSSYALQAGSVIRSADDCSMGTQPPPRADAREQKKVTSKGE